VSTAKIEPTVRHISDTCKIEVAYVGFPLVPKSMTLSDLERRNGRYFAPYQWRRNEFESGGHRSGAKRRKKFFYSAPSLFKGARLSGGAQCLGGHTFIVLSLKLVYRWSHCNGKKLLYFALFIILY